MTVQKLCDELTVMCHNGLAQAQVKHVSGDLVKNIVGVEMLGDDIALLISEKVKPKTVAIYHGEEYRVIDSTDTKVTLEDEEGGVVEADICDDRLFFVQDD